MSAVVYGTCLLMLLAGIWGAGTSPNLIHLVNCLAVTQSAAYLLLVSVGYKAGGAVPIVSGPHGHPQAVDPVSHALAVTGIVVGAVVQALMLALVVQIHKRYHSLDPDEIVSTRG